MSDGRPSTGAGNSVSVIVPTYREAGNLPALIDRLDAVRRENDLELELVICDDDSRDGTVELVERTARNWVRLLVRKTDRGLSGAVLDGLRLARYERMVVMDGDLSHPPEKIPELLAELARGADLVIGSRYVPGGSTDAAWGLFRWINSRIATLLARPLTDVKDPMSGFFAIERKTIERAAPLNPIGYKVCLELLVKCDCRRVKEIPIHFTDRSIGESKLTLLEQIKYIQHLRRLWFFEHPNWSYLIQFSFVGGSGVFVNLGVLTALTGLGVTDAPALFCGILVGFVSNFALNRRFMFGRGQGESLPRQLLRFTAASALGLLTNYSVALLFRYRFPALPIQLAAMIGIMAGAGFNCVTSRYLAFRKPADEPRARKPGG